MAHLLVVDDDGDVLDLVGGMLEREHEVVTAQSGVAALEILARVPVDLMIVDLRMPQVNGFQLIDKARETCPSLRIVILSAYYNTDDLPFLQMVHHYAPIALTKPVRADELLTAVKVALDSRIAPLITQPA